MRRFILKTGAIVLMLYSSLLTVHLILDYLSSNYVQKNNPNWDWSYIEKLDADELYVGNSRTWVHVDIEKISSKTNVKSYALAHDGGDIHILYLKLKKYLKFAESPLRINLQFDPTILRERKDLYGMNKYAPELFLNPSMKTSLKEKLGYSSYYYFIPLISYTPTSMVQILTEYNKDDNPSGYSCQEKSWDSPINFHDTNQWDSIIYESPEYLDSIFAICHDKNIVLNAIIPPLSPSYSSKLDRGYFIELFNRLTGFYETNGNIYDFSTLITERSYFYNHSHLNCDGASLYTDQLINELYKPTNISAGGF